MGKTKVKLRICDIDCTITSDDSEEYVRTISKEIDRSISDVLKKNDRISLSMAAIITAMTYCDESIKTKNKLAELTAAKKSMASTYDQLKKEADFAQTQVEQLRAELQTLQTLLTRNQNSEHIPVQDMVMRCINGQTTYVPKTLTDNQKANLFDVPAVKPTCVEDAHTLEELCRSINTNEPQPTKDNSTVNNSENKAAQHLSQPEAMLQSQLTEKHGKQSRHKKKQQKMAQKERRKQDAHQIPHASPTQRAEPPASEVLTGHFTRPKSPIEPEPVSDDTFIGYFQEHESPT